MFGYLISEFSTVGLEYQSAVLRLIWEYWFNHQKLGGMLSNSVVVRIVADNLANDGTGGLSRKTTVSN